VSEEPRFRLLAVGSGGEGFLFISLVSAAPQFQPVMHRPTYIVACLDRYIPTRSDRPKTPHPLPAIIYVPTTVYRDFVASDSSDSSRSTSFRNYDDRNDRGGGHYDTNRTRRGLVGGKARGVAPTT